MTRVQRIHAAAKRVVSRVRQERAIAAAANTADKTALSSGRVLEVAAKSPPGRPVQN